MKKKFLILGFLALTTSLTITSCSNDDSFENQQNKESVVTLSFTGENIAEYKSLNIQILEINTGITTNTLIENKNAYSLQLPKGSYKFIVTGIVKTRENEEIEVASSINYDVTNTVENISMNLYAKQFSNDFIIEEVFFVGVKTPEGKAYNASKYFKITNNTDKVLYADKLLILQSEFLTSVNNNVTPYDLNSYFPVKGVMLLPGTGAEYPVQPGDFIVIADNAINHNALNINAFNLENADFEFPNNNPTLGNVDNPAVPNAQVIFTTMTFNMIFLHNSGVEAYAVARFPEGENENTFLENYKYNYSYTNTAGNVTSKSVLMVPNSWILDGQNNGNSDKLLQLLMSPSIDASYTGIGTTYQNSDRFGKSVRRKVIGQTSNGKNVYKDTNNSAVDFIRNSEPSLRNGIVH